MGTIGTRSAETVGLIGVGTMGSYYAGRLLTAGRGLVVLDRDRGRLAPFGERGAREAANPFNLTSAVDAVLLAVPDHRAVESVMEGAEGVLSALAPGQLVLDMSTSLPASERRLARLCAERGASYLDAPVTWRPAGLTIMVGGDRAEFERALPLLELLGRRVGYVGPSGSGQLLKLVNQLIQAVQMAGLAEGLAFAEGVGLDPRTAADLLDLRGARAMVEREFGARGQLRLHTKDLGYVLEVAQEAGLPASLTAATNELFKAVAASGDPTWRQDAVLTYWDQRRGTGRDDRSV